jgi:hypothetical protein
VENLPSIIADGCLWSDSQRIARGLQTTNIGYQHIKRRRLNRPVTAGAGGKLGDYVPFNFCSRSVMLFKVGRGHEDYSRGEDEIIHLYSSVQTAIAQGRAWAFTDLHADLRYANHFASLQELEQVDWNVMDLEQWGGNDEIKAKRQAEFLVQGSFPWAAIEGIGVKSPSMAARIRGFLPGGTPPLTVQRGWYYP